MQSALFDLDSRQIGRARLAAEQAKGAQKATFSDKQPIGNLALENKQEVPILQFGEF